MIRKVTDFERACIIRWWRMKQELGTLEDQARKYRLPLTTIEQVIREEKEKLRTKYDNNDLPQRNKRRRKIW